MTNSSNELALALLATLEVRAKKKGQKSLVKHVVSRLRKAGADEGLVAQVEALNGGKPLAPAVKKNGHRAAPKSKAKPTDGALSA